jgi:hypothetical protein
MRSRLDEWQHAARDLNLNLISCGCAGGYGDGQAGLLRVMSKPEQPNGKSNNGDHQPGEQCEGERPDQNDIAVELVLPVKHGFLTEERQGLAAVRRARVGDRTGGVHDLLSPQMIAENLCYDPAK